MLVFAAVILGCTSTGWVGLCFLWLYVQELPKARPAAVLVLKRLRRRGNDSMFGSFEHPQHMFRPLDKKLITIINMNVFAYLNLRVFIINI